jgi:tetratricopeptide (TPR) repeat protein
MMPGSVKFLAFALIIAMIAIVSYANSDAVFTFYLQTWYLKVKKLTPAEAIAHAEKIRTEYEKESAAAKGSAARDSLKEEYHRTMDDYIETVFRVFSLRESAAETPERLSLLRYTGAYYLERNDYVRGSALALESMGDRIASRDSPLFMTVMRVLYEHRMYSDIALRLGRGGYPPEAELDYIHGMSLYRLGRHRDAAKYLHQADNASWRGEDVSFALATCYRSMKLYSEAVPYARRALADDPKDRNARALLVDLLVKTKQTKEAEQISRGR